MLQSFDDSIIGWTVKPTYKFEVDQLSTQGVFYNNLRKDFPFGIRQPQTIAGAANNGKYLTIDKFDTDLLNREYGWIMLCWAVKHFLYIVDTVLLMVLSRYKGLVHVKPIDILTPVLNCGLWVLWCVYAYT